MTTRPKAESSAIGYLDAETEQQLFLILAKTELQPNVISLSQTLHKIRHFTVQIGFTLSWSGGNYRCLLPLTKSLEIIID